jgi:hypothetical protein
MKHTSLRAQVLEPTRSALVLSQYAASRRGKELALVTRDLVRSFGAPRMLAELVQCIDAETSVLRRSYETESAFLTVLYRELDRLLSRLYVRRVSKAA